MLKDFKPEIKLFLFVAFVAVVLAVAGIFLLRSAVPSPIIQTPPPSSPVIQQSITFTSPKGTEQWPLGSKHTLTWDSTGIEKVRISSAVGGKAWEGAEVEASSGKYENFGVPDVRGFGVDPPYKVTIKISSAENPNVSAEVTITAINQIDTSTWQTYRNEEFGFEVKYPSNILYVADQDEYEPIIQSYSESSIEASPVWDMYISVWNLKKSSYQDAQDEINRKTAQNKTTQNWEIISALEERTIAQTKVYKNVTQFYMGGPSKTYYFPKFVLRISHSSSNSAEQFSSIEEQILSTFRFVE